MAMKHWKLSLKRTQEPCSTAQSKHMLDSNHSYNCCQGGYEESGKSGACLSNTVPYQKLIRAVAFFYPLAKTFPISLDREPGYKDHLLDSKARWTSHYKLSE